MPVTTVEITQIFFSQPFFDVQRELRFFFFKVYSISTAVEFKEVLYCTVRNCIYKKLDIYNRFFAHTMELE